MSIETKSGDLFLSGTHAIVNTVNCIGVMGRGIALQFKQRYPQMFRFYREACAKKELAPGKMWTWQERRLEEIVLPDGRTVIEPEWIINFPTKDHWMNASKIEWIASGLDDLRTCVTINGIESLALPALGCQNGGLRFDDVQKLIHDKLDDLPIPIILYEPQ
jgi:O-acetyl-ADP-ribose deacetylase (regulator of RNase III)